jgi:hypothetical protein
MFWAFNLHFIVDILAFLGYFKKKIGNLLCKSSGHPVWTLCSSHKEIKHGQTLATHTVQMDLACALNSDPF